MNCLAWIMKYILLIANLAFLICGILLIVLGSIMIGDLGKFEDIDNLVDTATIPILLIVLGCIVFVISFFGCCGAWRENSCCVTTYAVFLFIVMALQVAMVAWTFAERGNIIEKMGQAVERTWTKNNQENDFPMDVLQINFKCCGVEDYRDYGKLSQDVPKSCCGSLTKDCPSSEYQSRPGCKDEFMDWWTNNTDIICYAGIGVAIVELTALVFALLLASSIRRKNRK